MDPQQELFTALLLALRKQGYDVYDGALPPEDTPYPFVYLGDSRQTDEPNKSLLFGVVYQTIHVWHDNPKQRGTVSAVLSLMPFILLFNLIKAGANGAITFFIYKRVKHLFFKD